MDAVLGSYRALEKTRPYDPERILELPKDDNDVLGWKAVHKRVSGVPDDKAGYGVTRPEGIEDDAWNADVFDEFLDLAHKNDASPKLVKALVDWQMEKSIQAGTENIKSNAERQAALDIELRRDWGADYVEKKADLSRVATILTKGEQNKINEILGDREAAEAFSKIGSAIGEGKFPADFSGDVGQSAQDRIDQIKGSNEFMAMTKKPAYALTPADKKMQEELDQLYAKVAQSPDAQVRWGGQAG